MKTSKRVTNHDLLIILQEFMQMTADNFARLESRIKKLERAVVELGQEQSVQRKIMKEVLYEVAYAKHAANS